MVVGVDITVYVPYILERKMLVLLLLCQFEELPKEKMITSKTPVRVVFLDGRCEITVPHSTEQEEWVCIAFFKEQNQISGFAIFNKTPKRIIDVPDWDTSVRSKNEKVRVTYINTRTVKAIIPKGFFNDDFVLDIRPFKKEVKLEQQQKVDLSTDVISTK